jgi:DNA-binding SARP family transcriptional activator/tetratricopeptide (TPR) repeat protein
MENSKHPCHDGGIGLPSTVEFGILGPLRVVVAGHPVHVGGPRAKAVLAALLAHAGTAVSADRLADYIYGETTTEASRATIHVYLARLRGKLGDQRELLRTVPVGYQLDVTEAHVDGLRFERQLERCRAALHDGIPGTAFEGLSEALALWRGDAYGEFLDLPFAAAEAGRLEELRLAAVELRAQAGLALGRHAELVPELAPLLERHPLREPLVGHLVLALYRCGRQTEALGAYERCRAQLAEELGMDPCPALRDLHQAILRQDPALDRHSSEGAMAGAGGRPPAQAVRNLPPLNPAFTGREAILAQLECLLGAPATGDRPRTAALYGLGGAGKTQIAIEFAHAQAARTTVCWLVHTQERQSALSDLMVLAGRLGVDAGTEAADALVALWAELSRRSDWLLIYDNAEGQECLTGLIPPAGRGQIVITSRSPAWGRLGTPVCVPAFSRQEAVLFLARRTRQDSPCDASALAERLGDLPLALEQAAAYVELTSMGLRRYLQLFARHSNQLLARGKPTQYEATIDTTWQLNFERVAAASPLAAQLLPLCAFLAPEAIPLGLFLPLANDRPDAELAVEDAAGELLRYSLVSRDADGVVMHRIVQEAVRGSMSVARRTETADAALRLLTAAVPEDPASLPAWPQWQSLVAHVLALASTADLASMPPAAACALLHKAAVYLSSRGDFGSARDLLELALHAIVGQDSGEELRRARLLTDLGKVLDEMGEVADARDAQKNALHILEAMPQPPGPELARALNHLGHLLNCTGDRDGAIEVYRRGLRVLEATPEAQPQEVICVHIGLGYALWGAGRYADAEEQFIEALVRCPGTVGRTHPDYAEALSGLAMAWQDAGELAAVRACHEEALAVLEASLGAEHPLTAQTLDKLGYTLRLSGHAAEAITHHERAVELLVHRFGPDDPHAAMAMTNLGLDYLDAGRPARAHELQARASGIFQRAYGDEHPHTRLASARLADALAACGHGPGKRCTPPAVA